MEKSSHRISSNALKFLCISISAAALFPNAAQADGNLERIKAEKAVRIGFANYAPASYIGPDGEVTGFSPELAKAFLRSLGVERIDGVVGEFGSLIGGLQAGRFDMIATAMSIQPKRCEQIAFGDPEVQFMQGFAVKSGNPHGMHSYEDVANNPDVRIGMLTGAGQIRFADIAGIEKSRQVMFPDFDRLVAGLNAGRVEVAAGATMTLSYIVSKLDSPDVDVSDLAEQPADETGEPVISYGGMGFRKDDADLVDAWNAWWREARSSGEAVRIVEPLGFSGSDIPGLDVTASSICSQ